MSKRGSALHAALARRRWQWTRLKVFERDGWRCRRCSRAGRLECDHVVPLREGGDPWDMTNLQALCRRCHAAKSAREASKPDPARDEWLKLRDEVLFSP